MINKNDILTIEISDLGTTGEGIGKVDGYTLFVKDTVIGDVASVKVMKSKKNYGFARLIEIIKPSPNRVMPPCPVAKSCGGCQIQAMSYEEQLKFKEQKVYNNLKRIGGLEDFIMNPIIGMDEPFNYRNKTQYPVGMSKEGDIISGFFAGRTHSIIDVSNCKLGLLLNGEDINEKIMSIIKKFIEDQRIHPYNEVTKKGLLRHILIRVGAKTGQIMVCIIINGKELPKSEILVSELCKLKGMTDISLNINRENSNVIMGKTMESLYGPGYIEDFIGDVKFRISPLSFFQVNPIQTEKLYKKALDYAALTGKETVWDLYCGIGTISLFLAKHAKQVMGVEIVPQAIEDAKVNAKINKIDNVNFMTGAAEEVVTRYYGENSELELCQPDVIVVDPPRKGCDSILLDTMVKMSPTRIVYVSCDSATLARDVKYLSENGYKLVEATPCDMFAQTVHVECVVLMTRQEA